MPLAMTTHKTLREWRKMRGMTADQLAHAAGISMGAVYNAERAVTKPTLATAEKLAAALHVGVDDIEWLEPTNKPPSRRKPRGR